MSQVVVVGIGTDVGKTIVSSILVEKFKCAYWKPVQAGELENSDSMKIQHYCSHDVTILPEKYRLKNPYSPHYAAELDEIEIEENKLNIPFSENNILIESAGGLMVPLNRNLLFIDLIKSWDLSVVLVSKHYLGSINHTMLSLEILKTYGIELKKLIFIGDEVNLVERASEQAILNRFGITDFHRIPLTNSLDKNFVKKEAEKINFDIF
ncbi:MAG: dethiobiotin synthase [Bacteroidota bacterium]